MTDYHPLIARAVAGLAKSTGENRRALYERARSALVAQLRSLDPPLPENEITRERLLLEEAIRKVEAEAARQQRVEPSRPSTPPAKERGTEAPPAESKREAKPPEPSPALAAEAAAPASEDSVQETASERAASRADAKPAAASSQWAGQFRSKDRERSQNAAAQALKGFRELVAEVDGENEAAPTLEPPSAPSPESERERRPPRAVQQAPEPFDDLEPPPAREASPPAAERPKSRRQSWPALDEPDLDRFEPHAQSAAPRSSRRGDFGAADEPLARNEPAPPHRSLQPRAYAEDAAEPARGSKRAVVAALLGVVIVVVIGLTLFWQRDRLRAMFVRSPVTQAQRETAPSKPKISDRVGQASPTGQPDATTTAPGTQEGAPGATVGQRVVLYEEDPADAQGKRYVGSVAWRTETVSPGAGQSPELAVKGDLEIPERRINMTISVRRNTDKALPASHTIEIMFNLPADFPFGGISNVPGILMKQAEQTRGSPLAGLAVKVTSGFFLIGLSATEGDMQRNLDLLKERGWFDIPIVYNNGRRAILAVEKGTPGERAFKEAFTAWGE